MKKLILFLLAIMPIVLFTSCTEDAKEPAGPSANGHEYVDLGLSVKWATCNIGANKPEQYGNYYAWGEIEQKSNVTYENYKWYNSGGFYSKYCTNPEYGTIDNRVTLELIDDAAHTQWGDNWRMPTIEEINELMDATKCVWSPSTQNGVKGYKITSKKNNNSIFLPAAGIIEAVYGSMGEQSKVSESGIAGFYWTSSLANNSSDDSYCVLFASDYEMSYQIADFIYRPTACTIRPVIP